MAYKGQRCSGVEGGGGGVIAKQRYVEKERISQRHSPTVDVEKEKMSQRRSPTVEINCMHNGDSLRQDEGKNRGGFSAPSAGGGGLSRSPVNEQDDGRRNRSASLQTTADRYNLHRVKGSVCVNGGHQDASLSARSEVQGGVYDVYEQLPGVFQDYGGKSRPKGNAQCGRDMSDNQQISRAKPCISLGMSAAVLVGGGGGEGGNRDAFKLPLSARCAEADDKGNTVVNIPRMHHPFDHQKNAAPNNRHSTPNKVEQRRHITQQASVLSMQKDRLITSFERQQGRKMPQLFNSNNSVPR
jgi:hypothetical protein